MRAGDPKQNPVSFAFGVEEKSGMPRRGVRGTTAF
jgi:hypothetical protein